MKKPIPALLALLLLLAGCRPPAPVQATPTPEPTPAPTPLSPVYTDWSKLTPYEPTPPLYTLHPGYHAGGLEARDDYGVLLPYIGAYTERYIFDWLPLWGLVNDKGELVCDPVYARISCYDDFLLLRRGDPAHYDPENGYAREGFSFTLAAPDGRWAHEFRGTCLGAGHGVALTADLERNLTVWNRDGEVAARFDVSLFTPWLGEEFFWGIMIDMAVVDVNWADDRVGYLTAYRVNGEYQEEPVRLYLDFTTGAVLDAPPPGYGAEFDYEAQETQRPTPPEIEGFSYFDPIIDRVTGITYYYGYYRGGQYADDPVDALFDGEGRLLLTGCSLLAFEQNIIVHSGLCSTLEDDCFCYRSLRDGSLVFRCPMRTNSD